MISSQMLKRTGYLFFQNRIPNFYSHCSNQEIDTFFFEKIVTDCHGDHWGGGEGGVLCDTKITPVANVSLFKNKKGVNILVGTM